MHNNIKELRHQKLMKQSELVKRCNIPGFDVPMLSKIENGKAQPTAEIETALMLHLQASHDELYGEWKEIPVNGLGNKERIENPPMQVEELVALLKPGRKNAKSRRMLRQEMDVSDRMLRRTIELAAQYGYKIGNLSDGQGYFLIEDEAEAKAYYNQEFSRAMRIMRKIEPLFDFLNGGN